MSILKYVEGSFTEEEYDAKFPAGDEGSKNLCKMFQDGLSNQETLKITLNEIFNNEHDYLLEDFDLEFRVIAIVEGIKDVDSRESALSSVNDFIYGDLTNEEDSEDKILAGSKKIVDAAIEIGNYSFCDNYALNLSGDSGKESHELPEDIREEWEKYILLAIKDNDGACDVELQIGMHHHCLNDHKKALKYFKMGYDSGDKADCALMISKMFEEGIGVKKDVLKAFNWQVNASGKEVSSFCHSKLFDIDTDDKGNALINNEKIGELIVSMSNSNRLLAMNLLNGKESSHESTLG